MAYMRTRVVILSVENQAFSLWNRKESSPVASSTEWLSFVDSKRAKFNITDAWDQFRVVVFVGGGWSVDVGAELGSPFEPMLIPVVRRLTDPPMEPHIMHDPSIDLIFTSR
jgi:hypothetical protein